MNEKIKQTLNKVVEYWKKLTTKQKTLIISVSAAVVATLIILAIILNKTNYQELVTCTDTVQAADVAGVLDTNSIKYTTENNGLTIMVSEEDLTNATYLIAQDGITASGYTITDALNGGFSSTNADKEKLYQKYLEDKMKSTLESLDFVNKASVTFDLPKKTTTIINKDEEGYAAVVITLKKSIDDATAESMAKYIATAIGNTTTDKISIIDNDGNVLFQGNTLNSETDSDATAMQKIKDAYNNDATSKVIQALSTTHLYSTVTVSPNIDISFDNVDTVETTYTNPDEVLQSLYEEEQENTSGSGGIPGTDSNDDTTDYLLQDSSSTSTVTIRDAQYAVSSKIVHTQAMVGGTWNKDSSSVAVVVNKYIVYNQDDLEADGTLDGTTWSQYKKDNSDSIEIEIPANLTALVAKATGFAEGNISIIGYQVPIFEDTVEESSSITDYIQLILAVLILLLLAFVVFKSLRPIEVTELEPELSVESLLSSTKDNQAVEDIDLNEKSEVRIAIEKFVDENPEAVALLLRNWLDDDYN